MLCDILHQPQYHHANQKKTTIVIVLTVVMMISEIIAGITFGSIALLSDGIHMGTHTFALLITLLAYFVARKHASNIDFAFGTGKVGVLGGYSSAILLMSAAVFMGYEALERFLNPVGIEFNQSILVAVIGLVVNVASAFLLMTPHHHHDSEKEHHHDHNLRAAYLHVLADALTSLLAIIALIGGKYVGAIWLDPAVGLIGAGVILKWGYGLLKTTGKLLLDFDQNDFLKQSVKNLVEVQHPGRLTDIHIWQVHPDKRALICTVANIPNQDQQIQIKKTLSHSSEFFHTNVDFLSI